MKLRRAQPGDEARFFEHLQRHSGESGNGDIVFHPTSDHAEWNKNEFVEKLKVKWSKPLDQVGWEAVWIVEKEDRIVGHADLKSGSLKASLHRAVFGMGLEREARGQGWGRKLADTAITWARAQAGIDWIELYVFAHNTPAVSLYESLGFKQIGTTEDLFRINGQSIADIQMVLRVGTHHEK